MKVASVARLFGNALTVAGISSAFTIAEINGNHYRSPFDGQTITNVTGLVTATADNGLYLRSLQPDSDPATSEGLFVFASNLTGKYRIGDVLSLNGKVDKYRANKNYIYVTEFTKPTDIVVLSSGNAVQPLIIGKDTLSPPTEKYSSLDVGGIFGVPNAVNTISTSNPQLDPTTYGLDFWQSLVGELVTVKNAFQTSRPNSYGDVWVRGDWKTTGINSHGGITMLDGDVNPETIIIGTPLDGSSNPSDTRMGDYLGDITGVVTNAFGFYRILPLTHVTPLINATTEYPSVAFTGDGTCRQITVGDYNSENLMPNSAHMPKVIDQIVHKLRTPDLIFLQEVQDDSGDTNDGVTSANVTLATLTEGIEKVSGVLYDFVEISPVNNQDGGQPGGNIRQTYLYRADRLQLYKPNQGGSLDANGVVNGTKGPELTLNPGRIDPTNPNFDDSRKPIASMWKTVKGTGKIFFTINVHATSKGGSTTLHGDQRPPVNKGVEKRAAQNEVVAAFVSQILAQDAKARVIVAGDFNEFAQAQPMTSFAQKSGLTDLDEVTNKDPAERYTYLFDMNAQALDHIYVSRGIAKFGAEYEHLHLNTWQTYDGQTSDHDPSVAKFNLCGC